MSETTDPGGDDLQGPGDVGNDPGSDSGSADSGGDGDMDVPPTSNDDLTDDADN